LFFRLILNISSEPFYGSGVFPKCNVNAAIPCCMGLSCLENPKVSGDFRCGNYAELKVSGGDGFASPGGGYDQGRLWHGFTSVHNVENTEREFSEPFTSVNNVGNMEREFSGSFAFSSVVYSSVFILLWVLAIRRWILT